MIRMTLLLCLTCPLQGQVRGNVWDQAGAPIRGATVILKSSPGDKEISKGVTDDAGAYSLNAGLGEYSIVASAKCFKTVRYMPFYTMSGGFRRFDFVLPIGYCGGDIEVMAPTVEPLDLCDVLSDLPRYRDKSVAIRGEFITHDHGTVLVKEKCPKALITAGHVWPTMISLWPRPNAEGRPDFGSVSVDSSCRLAMKTAPPDTKLWVTFVGRLDTREHFEMVLRGDGKTVPNGYGHLGAFPAQLVYEQMRDCTWKTR